jgi:hypothetical protein
MCIQCKPYFSFEFPSFPGLVLCSNYLLMMFDSSSEPQPLVSLELGGKQTLQYAVWLSWDGHRLGVLNALLTYNISSLRWVYWDITLYKCPFCGLLGAPFFFSFWCFFLVTWLF